MVRICAEFMLDFFLQSSASLLPRPSLCLILSKQQTECTKTHRNVLETHTNTNVQLTCKCPDFTCIMTVLFRHALAYTLILLGTDTVIYRHTQSRVINISLLR